MSVTLDEEHGRIVREILAAHLPPGARVRAFGSRVKGTSRRYSDLDIAVDAEPPLICSDFADLREAFSESDLPFMVDVVDIRSASPEFQAIVDRDGVDLTAPSEGA